MNFHWTSQKSENFFSMGSFCTRFELQKYRYLFGTEQRCSIWINPEKLVGNLKNGIRKLVNFHASSLDFDGIVLSKADKVLDEKVQKS